MPQETRPPSQRLAARACALPPRPEGRGFSRFLVIIQDATLGHVVEKRQDQRERYAAFIVPTLERPSEVWAVGYDDGSTRDRYIKVFAGAKYDILIMVKVMEDGGVFWNMMNRDRAGMNALRIGDLRWMSQ